MTGWGEGSFSDLMLLTLFAGTPVTGDFNSGGTNGPAYPGGSLYVLLTAVCRWVRPRGQTLGGDRCLWETPARLGLRL
jgi:hypothetical protein